MNSNLTFYQYTKAYTQLSQIDTKGYLQLKCIYAETLLLKSKMKLNTWGNGSTFIFFCGVLGVNGLFFQKQNFKVIK